jgi:hypothetical protein
LPFLAAALRRHLRRPPLDADGLGETERRVLRAIAAGATDEAAVFDRVREGDSIFHLTDLILHEVIGRLRQGRTGGLARRGASPDAARRRRAGRDGPLPPAAALHAGVHVLPDPPWLWGSRPAAAVPGGGA